MADFRTKLITLAGVATMFTGMAYGQAVCTPSANPLFIRAEGNTEQVADTTIVCTVPNNGVNTAVTNGQFISLTVYLSPSVNITSAVLGSGSTAKSEAEAGLGVFGGALSGAVAGTVTANSVTFSNIALPAIAVGGSATVTITNIKVAASTVAAGSGVPTGIAETIFVSGNGVVTNALTATTVAYVTNGLAGVKSSSTSSNALCNATNTYSSTGVASTANFNVVLSEGFADAFKIVGAAGTNATLGSEFTAHTETGFGATNGTATNTASSGTRVQITFNNIPANVTVYLPLTVANNGATLTLVTSATGAYAAATGSNAAGAPGATNGGTGAGSTGTGGAAALTVSTGSATAVYETTAVDTAGAATFTVPVYLQAAANAVTAPTTAITATVSLAPIGATSNVPNFVSGSSTTTVNGSTFSACSTTLLFPFVTNQLGFDTGIAIANTSSDLLNGGTKSVASAESGTCSLTFFGSTAPAAAVVTPTVTAGTAYAAAASTLAPGFQGYAIASCNFLYAHGFAYVVYDLTQNNGAAMGYLADVISSNRTSPVPTLTSTSTLTAGVLTSVSITSANSAVSSTAPESWGH